MAEVRQLVQRMDSWARHLMPTVSVVGLTILGAVPFGVPGLAEMTPLYTLMGVFYWAVYRPDLMPPVIVFVAGILGLIVTFGSTARVTPRFFSIFRVWQLYSHCVNSIVYLSRKFFSKS